MDNKKIFRICPYCGRELEKTEKGSRNKTKYFTLQISTKQDEFCPRCGHKLESNGNDHPFGKGIYFYCTNKQCEIKKFKKTNHTDFLKRKDYFILEIIK